MSLLVQTALGAGRALAVTSVALALAAPLARLLVHSHGRPRAVIWALLLGPLLTPALLVSYAYWHFALQLMSAPPGKAVFYFVALVFKLVPVAAVILHFFPPALSPEASFTHRLLRARWWQRMLFWLRGVGRAPWIAGGAVFLLAFTDFELASLWSWKTWPVMIFDAQAGGLDLGASLRLAALPLAVELVVLVLVLWARGFPSAAPATWKMLRPGPRKALLAYLAVAASLGCVWPLFRVARQTLAGWRSVAQNFVLGSEFTASLAFATGAALLVWALAGSLRRRRFAVAWALPGLLGALLLSLFILTLFQLPALRPAYDTPLPLLLCLVLLLLPLALPLRWLLDASQHHPSLHLAHLARASDLVWRLDTRRRWLAGGLLFCWAWCDFTAGAMLAPVGFTPVFVRLHNLAHYGQTAVLSAMLLAAFLAPIAVLLLTAPLARWYAKRDGC
jgi:ABC-type Fe3+ transport system permease subunit